MFKIRPKQANQHLLFKTAKNLPISENLNFLKVRATLIVNIFLVITPWRSCAVTYFSCLVRPSAGWARDLIQVFGLF